MSTEFVLADLQLGEGRGRSKIKYKEDILYTKRMSKVFFTFFKLNTLKKIA